MKRLLFFILVNCFLQLSAQIHLGVFGALNNNFTDYDRGYYQKNVYDPENSFGDMIAGGGYLSFRYDVNDWFALRTDCEFQCFTEVEHSVQLFSPTTGGVFTTKYNQPFGLIPIMGCAYLQMGKWQLYENAGLFVGVRNSCRNSMKNFDFGFVDCLGVSYDISSHYSINLESKYYRGFINQHHTGSKYFKQPIYNSLFEIAVGLTYNFNK